MSGFRMACERLQWGIFVKPLPDEKPPATDFLLQRRGFALFSSKCEEEALLSESEDWSLNGRRIYPEIRASAPRLVAFDRRELDAILRVYGRRVAEGEWRDYAIDHLDDRAVFSIFRRTSEMPMFRVEKVPALARKQGAYRVVAASGAILKRGHELAAVIRVLDKPKLSLVN